MLKQKIGARQATVLEYCERFRRCKTKPELLNALLDGARELGHARVRLFLRRHDGKLQSFGCRGPHAEGGAIDKGEIVISDSVAGAKVLMEKQTIRYRYRALPYHAAETAFQWIDVERGTEEFYHLFEKAKIDEWTETPLFFGDAELGKMAVDHLGEGGQFDDVDVMSLDHLATVASTVLHNLRNLEKHRAAEAHYKSFVMRFPFCVFSKNLSGEFTFVNESLVKHFGAKSDADIIGKRDEDFFPPELVELYAKGDVKAIRDGVHFDKNEPFIVPKTGERLVIHVIKVAVKDLDGNTIGLQGAFWDVSDKNLAIDKTQEIGRIGSVIVSLPQGIIEASDELYRIFGLSPKDKKANLMFMRSLVHKPDLQTWDSIFLDTKMAKPVEAELRIEVDGATKWIYAKSEALRSANGDPLKIIGIVQDIDRTKRSKEILSRAAIACTGVHNLKDPITLLRNSIETLRFRYEEKDEALFAELTEIESNATRFVENIDHLIKVFKVGKPALGSELVNFKQFVEERVVRANVDAQKKGIGIEEEYKDGCVNVRIDRVLLRHAFENIFANAVRHCADGGRIKVKTFLFDKHPLVEITNDGPPFSPEVLSDFKLSCSPKSPDGTGLGLLISKAILELHNGFVTIDNDQANHPTVKLCLPYETN